MCKYGLVLGLVVPASPLPWNDAPSAGTALLRSGAPAVRRNAFWCISPSAVL